MAQNELRDMETLEESDVRGVSVINLLLGAWLIVTPFWFGYTSGTAKWNQLIIGVAVFVLAGLRALALRQKWLSFLTGLAGIWAIIAPFVLSYNTALAYWNEVVVGVVIALLAFYNTSIPAESHESRTQHRTPA